MTKVQFFWETFGEGLLMKITKNDLDWNFISRWIEGGSLVIRWLRVLRGVNMGADFKNLLRLAYGDGMQVFQGQHTPRALWDTPYSWPCLGNVEGVENVQTFNATIGTCSLNLYELGLVISACFCTPRPVLQRFPRTSISVFWVWAGLKVATPKLLKLGCCREGYA